ncbi:MAG: phosphate-starvation-inducible PsiE family protein [Deltaproteobacteria bacterium]|nr:phosphate-starvation-inducible PsiE family protein [Deltaproteobacteria bacterium]
MDKNLQSDIDKEIKVKPEDSGRRSVVIPFVSKFLTIIDDVILIWVALGIIGVAFLLMLEALTDFIFYTQHSISHIISDLMFVLIIMELFRQVMRQINRHSFSLNPFIFIGVIASIRGILLTQMKLGMGEAEWVGGVIQLGVHAGIVLILVAALLIYSKCKPRADE